MSAREGSSRPNVEKTHTLGLDDEWFVPRGDGLSRFHADLHALTTLVRPVPHHAGYNQLCSAFKHTLRPFFVSPAHSNPQPPSRRSEVNYYHRFVLEEN